MGRPIPEKKERKVSGQPPIEAQQCSVVWTATNVGAALFGCLEIGGRAAGSAKLMDERKGESQLTVVGCLVSKPSRVSAVEGRQSSQGGRGGEGAGGNNARRAQRYTKGQAQQ